MDVRQTLDLARPLVEKGRYSDALPLLQDVLRADPANGLALFWLGLGTYLIGGSKQTALECFASAERSGFDPFRIFLNRGILYAEAGDYRTAAADFQGAVNVSPQDQLAQTFLHQTLRNQAGVGTMQDLYYPPPHVPHLNAEWLETCSIPQSMQFMIDCLPAIRRLIAGWAEARDLEVLDVGTATSAGPALLARLYSGRFFGPRMRLDAIDLIRRYQMYARRAFPLVNYICGDLFAQDPLRRWDLVMCSHTIEHLTDPTGLIRHCQGRARKWALFYAPYEEKALIPGHLRSITRDYIDSLNPLLVEVLSSVGWQHPADPESRTVLFVLEGTGS